MTKIQACITEYLRQKYGVSVEVKPIGREKIKMIKENGAFRILAMNLFGDIMDADSKKIYAISNISHDLNQVGSSLPKKWTEV